MTGSGEFKWWRLCWIVEELQSDPLSLSPAAIHARVSSVAASSMSKAVGNGGLSCLVRCLFTSF
jgi:hypothetical protein